ncbi:glutathione-regulated potassium-efflux system protein KefB [Oceanospirillum multiglobuliferum]|uniref:cation:proton antiporter domain-containing protein n=1 Tax=Oceanospirillum multiglobuliferum TaxID=64969 RepID=UPI000999BA81|nr:cation:proton antiporter [Oceanospirillum multiglobuliferum]SKA03598.1 glutathione-regulated potassium-efflux system protein KefB [Oceanospirillum multiglobuliferum]
MHLESFITSALMVLIATSISVAIFKHFGLGSILGLLVAGIAVGPHSGGPYVTTHVEDVRHFTELGVVLLLFLIGLEMKPTRLWSMRREVFGLGLLQILVTGAAVGAYFYLYQPSWTAALLIGLTFALSSTAMVLQILQENGEISSRHGTASFAILLMQDLAIVPLLAIVPIISETGRLSADVPMWQQVGTVCGMLVLIGVFGRYVLPMALDQLSRRGNKEGFLLVVMLSVFLAAWSMHYAGISMALGAFIMGMLLSSSNYRLQVQASIEPYKGILMSLFFVAVGMSIDLAALAEQPTLFIQHILVIISIKFVILVGLAMAFGFARPLAIRIGLLLSQGGEFGFVLFGSAKALQVISDETFVLAIGVISVSMLLTPLMIRFADGIGAKLEKKRALNNENKPTLDIPSENKTGRVIIAGFGRVGFTVGSLLKQKNIPFVAFDCNPIHIAKGQEHDMPVFYGDVGDPHLLEAAHMGDASLVVMTIDHTPSALRAIQHIRMEFPNVPIISRAKDLNACHELVQAGATHAFPEAMESSLHLGGEALKMIHVKEKEVEALLEAVRDAGYQSLVTDKK